MPASSQWDKDSPLMRVQAKQPNTPAMVVKAGTTIAKAMTTVPRGIGRFADNSRVASDFRRNRERIKQLRQEPRVAAKPMAEGSISQLRSNIIPFAGNNTASQPRPQQTPMATEVVGSDAPVLPKQNANPVASLREPYTGATAETGDISKINIPGAQLAKVNGNIIDANRGGYHVSQLRGNSGAHVKNSPAMEAEARFNNAVNRTSRGDDLREKQHEQWLRRQGMNNMSAVAELRELDRDKLIESGQDHQLNLQELRNKGRIEELAGENTIENRKVDLANTELAQQAEQATVAEEGVNERFKKNMDLEEQKILLSLQQKPVLSKKEILKRKQTIQEKYSIIASDNIGGKVPPYDEWLAQTYSPDIIEAYGLASQEDAGNSGLFAKYR